MSESTINVPPYREETHHRNGNNRSLGSIILEMKEELRDFINTRVDVVKAELQETSAAARVALPLGAIALVFSCAGFLLLTSAAVVLVAFAFAGHALAWFYATLIVGLVWIALAAACLFFAYNEFRSHSRFPQRTIEVLKADKAWLQTETRSLS